MVEQTPEGRLHLAWFSGTKEGANKVSIVYAQLDSKAEASSKNDDR